MKYIKLLEQYSSKNIKEYIQSKGYKPSRKNYPKFLFHGTKKNPNEFFLDDDLDWYDVDGNSDVWDIEMPDGYLFLSTDIRESQSYGKYIIPFEIPNDVFTVKVNSDSPSIVFDDDFNYGSEYNIWQKFEESTSYILEVRGYDRSTFISYIPSLISRIDISKEFYGI